MASFSSSSTQRQHLISSPSSTTKLYRSHSHDNDVTTTNESGFSSEYRTAVQTVQLANHLQQLNFNNDHQLISNPSITSRQNELLAEQALIEKLKELVIAFMNRSGRHYTYDTHMHWNLVDCDRLHFSVTISIKKPSHY